MSISLQTRTQQLHQQMAANIDTDKCLPAGSSVSVHESLREGQFTCVNYDIRIELYVSLAIDNPYEKLTINPNSVLKISFRRYSEFIPSKTLLVCPSKIDD